MSIWHILISPPSPNYFSVALFCLHSVKSVSAGSRQMPKMFHQCLHFAWMNLDCGLLYWFLLHPYWGAVFSSTFCKLDRSLGTQGQGVPKVVGYAFLGSLFVMDMHLYWPDLYRTVHLQWKQVFSNSFFSLLSVQFSIIPLTSTFSCHTTSTDVHFFLCFFFSSLIVNWTNCISLLSWLVFSVMCFSKKRLQHACLNV